MWRQVREVLLPLEGISANGLSGCDRHRGTAERPHPRQRSAKCFLEDFVVCEGVFLPLRYSCFLASNADTFIGQLREAYERALQVAEGDACKVAQLKEGLKEVVMNA